MSRDPGGAPPPATEAALRAHRRRLMCETLRARARARGERILRMHGEIEEMRERGPERRWLRDRVLEMIAAGWTAEEMAEVGITSGLLGAVGLAPPRLTAIRRSRRGLPWKWTSMQRSDDPVAPPPEGAETEWWRAEDERGRAEQQRQVAEEERISSETERKLSEEARWTREEGRALAEEFRAYADRQRASAEATRAIAEEARAEAERARQDADSARRELAELRRSHEDQIEVMREVQRTLEAMRRSPDAGDYGP